MAYSKLGNIDAIALILEGAYKARIMTNFPDGGKLIGYYLHKGDFPENTIGVEAHVWQRFIAKYPKLAPK